MKHNSHEQLSTIDKTLAILFLAGIFILVGSITALCIGTAINHDWFFVLLNFTLPLSIVGIVVLFVSVKLMEILK